MVQYRIWAGGECTGTQNKNRNPPFEASTYVDYNVSDAPVLTPKSKTPVKGRKALQKILDEWDSLPTSAEKAMLAIVKSASKKVKSS